MIEVMGRNCGYLALMSGIAGGAEAIVVPEIELDPESLAQKLSNSYEHGKAHAIIVVAEGAKYNAAKLSEYFDTHHERLGFDIRSTILGHVQRGGNPSAFDRILASRLGAAATESIANNQFGVLMGLNKGEITPTPLKDVVANKKQLDMKLFSLAELLD